MKVLARTAALAIAALLAGATLAVSQDELPALPDAAPDLAAPSQAYTVSGVVFPDVALRDGVTVDLRLTVYLNNDRRGRDGGTVFAVHGMSHTAATWEPMAEALFQRSGHRPNPSRLVALDLPGHGLGSQPSGALFGELTLDDYVSAVIAALDRLRDLGVRPRTILGHSLRGIMTQFAQGRLATSGTSLRRAYGVKNAVLFGTAVPEPIPTPGINLGVILAPFMTFTPELGPHVALPPPLWQRFLFSDLSGQPGAETPSVADIVARGYVAPISVAMIQQLGPPRPSIEAGLFDQGSGTVLTLVGFEQDTIIRPELLPVLYEHLTGEVAGHHVVVVGGPASVHDMHISDPAALLAGMGWLARVF